MDLTVTVAAFLANWETFEGPFQPELFYDSVTMILWIQVDEMNSFIWVQLSSEDDNLHAHYFLSLLVVFPDLSYGLISWKNQFQGSVIPWNTAN